MAIDTTEWLTVGEACEYLRVTRATLYRWARAGRVRMTRVGKRATRLRRSDVEALLAPERREPRVTVVGEDRFQVYEIDRTMATVRDAVWRFEPHMEGHLVFRNQTPWLGMDAPLEPGDILVVLAPAVAARAIVGQESEEDEHAWLTLADSSFAADWNNPKDAIYDNWQDLYGIHDR
jgi:excisionase family DNA binding protein